MDKKLVEKIADILQEDNIYSPSNYDKACLTAEKIHQLYLSDPNIIEIDPDAELPRYLCDPSVSIAENIRRFKGILKEAGWVKKK